MTMLLLGTGIVLMVVGAAAYLAGRPDRDLERTKAMDERHAADQLYGARKIHGAPRRPPQ